MNITNNEYTLPQHQTHTKAKYEKLASQTLQEKGRKIAREYLRYAGYMEGDKLKGDRSPGFEKVVWNGYHIASKGLKERKNGALENIIQRVKSLGFHEDSRGDFYDTKTGTIFNIIYDVSDKENPEVIFCFKGLRNERHLDVSGKTRRKVGMEAKKAAFKESIGGIPQASLQVMEIGKILKDEGGRGKLKAVAIGHSHGGGLAQIAALTGGIKGVVFNSRPMGAKIRRRIGKETIQENVPQIVAFSGKGDFLTHTKIINKTASVVRKLKIPLPRTLGTGYNLPKAENRPKGISPFTFHHISFYDQLHILLKNT
jgi:hypothetical protein